MDFGTVRRLLEQVILPDTDYKLAGGYARDLAHGLPPKDLDYWVRYTLESEAMILRRLRQVGVSYEEYAQYESNEHDTRNRVAVFKLNCGADIILSLESPDESIAKFDFNLNQYEMQGQVPVFVGTQHPKEGLLAVSPDVSEARVLRITSLWNELYGGNV